MIDCISEEAGLDSPEAYRKAAEGLASFSSHAVEVGSHRPGHMGLPEHYWRPVVHMDLLVVWDCHHRVWAPEELEEHTRLPLVETSTFLEVVCFLKWWMRFEPRQPVPQTSSWPVEYGLWRCRLLGSLTGGDQDISEQHPAGQIPRRCRHIPDTCCTEPRASIPHP